MCVCGVCVWLCVCVCVWVSECAYVWVSVHICVLCECGVVMISPAPPPPPPPTLIFFIVCSCSPIRIDNTSGTIHKTKPLDENNLSPYKLPCCVRALMVAFAQTPNAVRDSQAWCDDGFTSTGLCTHSLLWPLTGLNLGLPGCCGPCHWVKFLLLNVPVLVLEWF